MTDPPPFRLRRLTFRLIRFVVLAYAAVTVFLVLMESRLVYPGAYFGKSAPGYIDSGIETVVIDSLPCRLCSRDDPRHHVLFLHGNGIRAAELDQWTRRLSDALNATVLTAEYRGFEDDRSPSEAEILHDCESIHQYMQKTYELAEDDIVIYGRSFGGGCAAALAEQHDAKILVMDRTFDAIWKVAANKFPFVPVEFLMRNRFESATRLRDFGGTLIQLHGTDDEVVPIERGQALFNAVTTENKIWIEVPGMRHNDILGDQWLDRLAATIGKATDRL